LIAKYEDGSKGQGGGLQVFFEGLEKLAITGEQNDTTN
jgi:hypothetical protein